MSTDAPPSGLAPAIIETVPNPVVCIRRDGSIVWTNRPARALGFGTPANPAPVPEGLSESDEAYAEAVHDTIDAVRSHDGKFDLEFNGTLRPDVFIIEPEPGIVAIIVRVWLALDELRRELTTTRELMHQVFDVIPAAIFAKDLHERYTLANKHSLMAFGTTLENVLGHTHVEVFGESPSADEIVRQDKRVLETGTPIEKEIRVPSPDGDRWFITNLFPLFNGSQEIQGIAGVSTDITSRVLAEMSLREREERFRLAFDRASSGMALISLDGAIERVNASLCQALGRTSEEIVGRDLPDLLHSSDSSNILALLENPTDAMDADVIFTAADGSAVVTEFSASVVHTSDGDPIQIVAHINDVTDRRAFEERTRQAEKLELISQLTSGIAHDINNILGVILGHADLLLGELDDPILREDVEVIATAATRAGSFTNRLLGYTQHKPMRPMPFLIDPIVTEVATMLRRSVLPGMEVEVKLAGDGVNVVGDAAQLQSAILNLGLNARDALGDEGTITLRTVQVNRRGDALVRVSVEDNGPGLTPEDQRRIFEPFYTTKADGRGTGLGLTSALSAAHSHGGTLQVDSEVGRGAAFTLELPVSPPCEPLPPPMESGVPGAKVLLVVDDDPAIRRMLSTGLERNGYVIILASDGLEAIQHLESSEQIDAVIFDLKMPNMNGAELHEHLRTRWPAIPGFLMTGNLLDPAAAAVVESGLVPAIQKPFRVSDVLEHLRPLRPQTH